MKCNARRAWVRQAAVRWFEELEERRLLAVPVLESIGTQNVPAGKSVIVPLRASDADGDPLTYSFQSNSGNFTVQQHTGNDYVQMDVQNYGTMTFQLFNDLTPKTVAIFEGLVQAGFYNGLTFDFSGQTNDGNGNNYGRIQGGDQGHSTTGQPPFQFDDEFNAGAIFSGDGQLAMAKPIQFFQGGGSIVTRDSNGTQFFVTQGQPRGLDFANAIFGQLVRGFDVRDAILAAPHDNTGKPTTPITITDARIIQDTQDAVITINADAAGSGDITVTVDDGHGGQAQKTIHVIAATDTFNDKGFLHIDNILDTATPDNQPVSFTLSATDIGFNPGAVFLGAPPSGWGVDATGNVVTVTPPSGAQGSTSVFLEYNSSPGSLRFDGQNVWVWAGTHPLSNVQATAFNASAGVSSQYQVATFHDTNPSSQSADFIARIVWGDGTVSMGTVSGSGGDYAVSGTHQYSNAGNYPVRVMIGRSSNPGTSAIDMPTMAKPTVTVSVAPPALTVNAGGSAIIQEGSTFSGSGSFEANGGSSWAATVDYGDGSGVQPLTLNADKTFSLSHQYVDNGTFNITIDIEDNLNNSAEGTRQITVNSVAPSPAVTGAGTGVRGVPQKLGLSATDPSPADSNAGIRYVINWGDKTAAQTTGAGVSSASHTYAANGKYTITIRAKDKDGKQSGAITKKVTIKTATLINDPFGGGKKALLVGGTKASNKILIKAGKSGSVTGTIDGASIGSFKPTGWIIVYGGAGNDTITIDSHLKRSAELHGGSGKDNLTGGAANDILLGEASNDVLTGGGGRDLLIGGDGADKLNGASGDDMLVAGSTQFDSDESALAALMSEWSRTDAVYADRVSHITGQSQGNNGTTVLSAATVSSDNFADVLTGSKNSDLFFANRDSKPMDKITDQGGGESQIEI